MGEPLLCSLGFHKWRNYGKMIEISWREPAYMNNRYRVRAWSSGMEREQKVEQASMWTIRSKAVYVGQECKRCGMKLRRKLVTNSDGTISCIGWEPDTEKTDRE